MSMLTAILMEWFVFVWVRCVGTIQSLSPPAIDTTVT